MVLAPPPPAAAPLLEEHFGYFEATLFRWPQDASASSRPAAFDEAMDAACGALVSAVAAFPALLPRALGLLGRAAVKFEMFHWTSVGKSLNPIILAFIYTLGF